MKILAIDVGGTHVKVLAMGQRAHRRADSGPKMTARRMVSVVKRLSTGWSYDHVAIGYPGPVVHGHPVPEPHNLGGGWVGFDFARAFGHPVKVIRHGGGIAAFVPPSETIAASNATSITPRMSRRW
jgi:polyphosphate glucokinase